MSDLFSRPMLRVSGYAKQHIRNKATELMDSVVRIYKPNLSDVSYDRVTGKATAGPGTLKYEGPARVWEVTGGQQILVGDEEIVVTQTYLSIPYWVTPLPESDDIVQMVASDDPDLTGRTLTITSTVRGGGLRASRRFQVQISDSKKATW